MVTEWRVYYLDYEELKSVIDQTDELDDNLLNALSTGVSETKPVKPGDREASASVRFLRMLDREFAKINGFVKSKIAGLEISVGTLLRHAQSRALHAGELTATMQREATAIGREIVQLDRFIAQNKQAFRKIVKKFDKVTEERASRWLAARVEEEFFCKQSLEPFVVTLSDVWTALRKREVDRAQDAAGGRGAGAGAGAGEGAGAWEPPSDFQRQTAKYWVKPEDIMQLVTTVLPHLPILIMGRKPKLDESNILTDDLVANVPLSGSISSLYLDSADMNLYHTRLRRDEGARLYRLRWYGLNPTETSEIFAERKTHHEKWVGAKSTKERLALDHDAVASLMRGECDIEQQCRVRTARGQLKEAAAMKAVELGREFQAAVVEQKLRPAVRSVYRRCAFQLTSSNALRITLDTNLQLVKEGPTTNAGSNGNTPGAWCRSLSERIAPADLINFPHAVLEIKLQAEAPAWVDELIASGIVVPAPKFSKFLTGCAALHRDKMRVLPEWFDDSTLQHIVNSRFDAAGAGVEPQGKGGGRGRERQERRGRAAC
eukprot:g3298.t1